MKTTAINRLSEFSSAIQAAESRTSFISVLNLPLDIIRILGIILLVNLVVILLLVS